MTNFKKQVLSAAAVGAVFLNLAVPAMASTTIEITGNGAGSDNWTTVNQTTTNTVTQNNTANVTNKVNADANTGKNDANFNTGGDVVVSTGDAKVKTNIQNALNSNHAEVDCCAKGDTDVKISGNGAKSDNGVVLNQTTATSVGQNNVANVTNKVDAVAKTGKNDASLNTGGDVLLKTGDAKVESTISTLANVNSAVVGGDSSHGSNDNPSASFVISGNGAGSDNYITAALANATTVAQNNLANVTNDVDADADTGHNDAGFNTSGDVIIGTGDATVKADVDNAVNFNHADVDCGCTWDVLAKIAGNGADPYSHHKSDDPDNLITLGLTSGQSVGQGNGSNLNNDLGDLNAKTGKNDANSNTGEVDGESDPAVVTGDANIETGVANSGNVNVLGDMDFDFPEVPEVDFSFNMGALWAFFGLSS